MIDILFQDHSIFVLNKPAGLVVAPTNTQSEPTLVDLLRTEYRIDLERAGLVHRLDKDTSGVMVVAKTQNALENLQNQFKSRQVKKEYLALVHGQTQSDGEIDGAIGRNPQNREKFIVTPDGKPATTRYQTTKHLEMEDETINRLYPEFNKIQRRKMDVSGYKYFSLLRCFPLTGRTHQIRVHLKYIDHPIVGDERYAGRKISRLDHRWCARQFLHAAKLEFNHPETGERMSFESELPEDLILVLLNLNETTK